MRPLPPRRAVAGVSAPEAIVALLLGLFVVHLGLSTLARLRTVEAGLASRRDGLVAMRVARHVLRRELRHGIPARDRVVGGDSVGLRAFRGTALVCPMDTLSVEVTVWYSGDRRPDPAKDSVLLVGPTGERDVRDLVGVGAAAAPCGPVPQDSLERWRLDAPGSSEAVVARLFERGSYHLALSALRYRRGNGGRQPLTPEVWTDATTWVAVGDRLGIEVHHQELAVGSDWEALLSASGS